MMEQKYQVVVVDDYRISRTFFEMMVQNDVRYALAGSFSNASDAVAFCLNHPVDLMILDVMMRTGIDGITAARQNRHHRSDAGGVCSRRIGIKTSLIKTGTTD